MLKSTRCFSPQLPELCVPSETGWPISHVLLLPQSSALARFKSSNICDAGTFESDSECKHTVQTLDLFLLVESTDSKVWGGEH